MIFTNRKQTLVLTFALGIALALGIDYPARYQQPNPRPRLRPTLALAQGRGNTTLGSVGKLARHFILQKISKPTLQRMPRLEATRTSLGGDNRCSQHQSSGEKAIE